MIKCYLTYCKIVEITPLTMMILEKELNHIQYYINKYDELSHFSCDCGVLRESIEYLVVSACNSSGLSVSLRPFFY